MSNLRTYAYDWIALLLFAAIPTVIFWQSATSLARQGAASGGPMDNAAFYPRIVASAMTLLVVLQVVRLVLARVQSTSPFQPSETTRLALFMTGLFVLYLVALPYAGFHLATPALCVLLFSLLGLSALGSAFAALILWIGASYVFEGLLNVVLPVGVFQIALFN